MRAEDEGQGWEEEELVGSPFDEVMELHATQSYKIFHKNKKICFSIFFFILVDLLWATWWWQCYIYIMEKLFE